MPLFFEIALAFRTLRSNGLRTLLTVAIIAVGIMALVGILTAFEILKTNVTDSFSNMGANTFQITSETVRKKGGGRRPRRAQSTEKMLRYEEALAFKERFGHGARTGISLSTGMSYTVQYEGKKTYPNVTETGVDEHYLELSGSRLAMGRAFSNTELATGSYVCILGASVARRLSPTRPAALLEQDVTVNSVRYRVVGIAAEKGGSLGMNADDLVLVPLENARRLHSMPNARYILSVAVQNPKNKAALSEEAEGLMRQIRKLAPGEEADFAINSNESLLEMTLEVLNYLLGAAVVIAAITLLGSIIGLMNIMLVSVAERTREIGVSKALGARAGTIRRQFLLESVLIGLLGGVLGALLGVGIGNVLGLAFKSGFIVPWLWMGTGILLCIIAGVLSGIYPALKASRLNPITALRYE